MKFTSIAIAALLTANSSALVLKAGDDCGGKWCNMVSPMILTRRLLERLRPITLPRRTHSLAPPRQPRAPRLTMQLLLPRLLPPPLLMPTPLLPRPRQELTCSALLIPMHLMIARRRHTRQPC